MRLFKPHPRLCGACNRVEIVIAKVASDPGKSVPLDTRAPTYVLDADGETARRSTAMASHWATCRAAEVARKVADGAQLPSSWRSLVDELAEVLSAPETHEAHRAAELLLESYYGKRPPGAPTPRRVG